MSDTMYQVQHRNSAGESVPVMARRLDIVGYWRYEPLPLYETEAEAREAIGSLTGDSSKCRVVEVSVLGTYDTEAEARQAISSLTGDKSKCQVVATETKR